MSKYRNAPAIIIWVFAIIAILTPPQIAAASLTVLLDAQEQLFDVMVEEPSP